MNIADNKLFAQQAEQMLRNLREPDTFKKLFFKLVVDAKETAHKNLIMNSPEYNTANKRAHEQHEQFRERLKGSDLLDEFDKLLEADDLTDTIWAEEMYLKGIQDTMTFILLTSKENVLDITKISIL